MKSTNNFQLKSALLMAGLVSVSSLLMALPARSAESLTVNLTDKTNTNITNYPTVKLTLTETTPGTVTVKVDVVPGPTGYIGDLRGVYFNIPGVNNLSITPVSGGPITAQSTNGNFGSFSNSADLQGTGLSFNSGVEIGRQGIARGDDFQTSTFTLSGTGLSLSSFSSQSVGARLMSVGSPTGSRDLSSKTAATAPVYTPPVSSNPETPSNPVTPAEPETPSNPVVPPAAPVVPPAAPVVPPAPPSGGNPSAEQVPEPTTIIGSIMGLAGLMGMRRKAKANKTEE